MKIFLTGMMGCGKSTIGIKLARKLDCAFLDTDEMIEKQENLNIQGIFNTRGEAAFRIMESNILRSIHLENAVIATGGGLPCHSDNTSYMLSEGIVIYLYTPVDLLLKRLKKSTDRPLVAGLTPKKMKNTLESLIEKRSIFYEKAHIIIQNNESQAIIIQHIINAIEKVKN